MEKKLCGREKRGTINMSKTNLKSPPVGGSPLGAKILEECQ